MQLDGMDVVEFLETLHYYLRSGSESVISCLTVLIHAHSAVSGCSWTVWMWLNFWKLYIITYDPGARERYQLLRYGCA